MAREASKGNGPAGPAPRRAVPAPVVEAVCFVLSLIALYPLLTPGYIWGHDTGAHLFRIAEVARALHEGVLYPRFLPDAYGGLGGPILNFNPVAPYYVPALLVILSFGPIAALKISAGAMMIAGGVAVRILARPHLGRAGAAVAGFAYVYLPYRIANLYVRMAYSELAAMVILPLAMAAARRAARQPSPPQVAMVALGMGILLATHFPTSVIGIPAVFLYTLWSVRRGGHLRAMAVFAIAFALALMMSAFSWLPAITEQGQTHYQDSTAGYDNYAHHFLGWPQLFTPEWGFGQSLPGSRDQMSFQIGWVHVLALLVGVAAAFRFRLIRPLISFCALITVAGSILMLGVTKPLWDRLWILQNIQFPWRILALVGIGTSLAAGVASVLPAIAAESASRISPAPAAGRSRTLAGRRSAIALLAGTALIVAAACLPYLEVRRGEGKDSDFTPEAIRRQYLGEVKFQPKEVARIKFVPDGPRASLLAGGTAAIVEEKTHRMSVEVDSPGPTTLRLHLFHTPGWKARIDRDELSVRGEPGTALVLVDVPAGRHRVNLRFSDTPVRRVGWILSGAGLLISAVAGADRLWRRGLFA